MLWAHETLLKILDSDLLPVYLDVLQVLKSKSPVLVEHMIHSSVTREGGEALGLLLKRPWSIVTGMEPVDRQVRSGGEGRDREGRERRWRGGEERERGGKEEGGEGDGREGDGGKEV